MREKELIRRENLFEMNKRILRLEESYVTTSSEDGKFLLIYIFILNFLIFCFFTKAKLPKATNQATATIR